MSCYKFVSLILILSMHSSKDYSPVIGLGSYPVDSLKVFDAWLNHFSNPHQHNWWLPHAFHNVASCAKMKKKMGYSEKFKPPSSVLQPTIAVTYCFPLWNTMMPFQKRLSESSPIFSRGLILSAFLFPIWHGLSGIKMVNKHHYFLYLIQAILILPVNNWSDQVFSKMEHSH